MEKQRQTILVGFPGGKAPVLGYIQVVGIQSGSVSWWQVTSLVVVVSVLVYSVQAVSAYCIAGGDIYTCYKDSAITNMLLNYS